MPDVVTEMQEDGNQAIISVSGPSNYDMELGSLNGAIPETPSLENLSKLFTPTLVLKVTAPDGTVIPFTYKRIDPMSLLSMDASPIQITDELMENLSVIDAQGEDVTKTMNASQWKQAIKTTAMFRKASIQMGVISPAITDEIYKQLDPQILEALHQAITGGVTSNAELVSHFRSSTEA